MQCNMEEEKVDPLFLEIVQKAMSDEKTEFQLIPTNNMYTATKAFARGTKKIIEMFNQLAQVTAEEYCAQIQAGKTDLKLLLAHIQYHHCLDFYKNELKTAKSMMQEYRAYVFGGNLMKTILSIPRAEEDMVDYRTLPWKLF